MNRLTCLVVDDDPDKASQIQEVVCREFGDDFVEIVCVGSAYEAGQRMRKSMFDLLFIDLNLPMRKDGEAVGDGGIKLLKQVMRATGKLIRPSFVVGITAFEDLASRDVKDFREQGWALIQYEADSAAWESTIANHCRQIAEIQKRYASSEVDHVDVCICTALAEPELRACKDIFSVKLKSVEKCGRNFDLYELIVGERKVSVCLASASEMGIASIASLTTQLICNFRPSVCLLLGICAGIRSEIGDLVIAESSVNYQTGKWEQADESLEAVFKQEPRYHTASPRILEALRCFNSERKDRILAIPSAFRGVDPPKAPATNIGPVACGAAVIESEQIVGDLQFQNRKLEGLEMESYGFYVACRNAYPGLEYAMIKAVCDTGRPPKRDEFQSYASFLSAEYAIAFLRDLVERDSNLLL
ncbi:hypothetical protein [Novipirellula caenicola]|uniref:Response regulatory domain-containing protein n=1 Tax=Novipirellula caenicola TaxID=1536901 RepID=A0ABP9VVZ5_9BACT